MYSIGSDIIQQMNELGRKRRPFVFLFDFDCRRAKVLEWDQCPPELLWRTPQHSNFMKEDLPAHPVKWEIEPVSIHRYTEAFELVQKHIHGGDSYLLNLTMPTKVKTKVGS